MEIPKTQKKINPTEPADLVVDEVVTVEKVYGEELFLLTTASAPTNPPAGWYDRIKIKDDGSELYVWDGSDWRTFISASGFTGAINTSTNPTINVTNGVITSVS